MRKYIIFILFICSITINGQNTYYVQPFSDNANASDLNAGTNIIAPWATWQKAFETANAGDTVYFRGGTWYPDYVVPTTNAAVYHSSSFGNNGERGAFIHFFNYPGEVPILDCSTIDTVGRNFNVGLSFSGSSFIHIKGLQIANVLQPQSGELASGIGADGCSHMLFENTVVSGIGGRGMTYWGIAGHPDYPSIPTDTTMFINCDVYNCADSLSEDPGNGADGWKLDNEAGGYLEFYGCRAWNCSDDGFDISGPGVTVFNHCWSFDHNFPGALDGNGFKFGANRGNGASIGDGGVLNLGTIVYGPRKIVKNCLSVNNAGFGLYDLAYEPYYPNNSRIYNNTIYNNGIGISMEINSTYSGQNPSIYRNNIIYGTKQNDAAGRPYNLSVIDIYIESNNTWRFADASIVGSLPYWIPNDDITVTDDDFISLDWSQLSNPRKADGSLPDITFMKLASGSDLIDAGMQIPSSDSVSFILDYEGDAPDMGYGEGETLPSTPQDDPEVSGRRFAFSRSGNLAYSRSGNPLIFRGAADTTSGDTPVTGQIIADHTVVDLYDDIPQQWIDSVKTMLVTIAGMSHSFGYYTGALLLEQLDTTYQVTTSIDIDPVPSPGTTELTLARPWMTGEDIWTSPSGIASAKTSQIINRAGNPYDAYIFGWSYQATWDNEPGGTIDPVHNVRWAGRTEGGLDGSNRWGLDAGDSILTNNRVCMDTYLNAFAEFTEYCETNLPTTHMIYSTLIVDGGSGTEAAFQRELKSEHIREYAEANPDVILFDFGDILSHSNSGEANTVNWDDGGTLRPHPQIHPENLMDYDASWNIIDAEADPAGWEDHIGEVGALRLAKAMWWMLARMAGWDGTIE